ncbi:hypothetical protein KVT40_000035 [Elsinoe batatas]|uniref:Acyltransferase 3 domain-containing protein n=1 Tax=Elsinoe batatas TaxID=2601811 RepID=A0A8K0LB85_9PEZI|nr:hypothetical protein KVT40_000035 [Elsinoe batatas]
MLYLGQISFGVYLMHILVIFVVWNHNIQPWVNATVVHSWWRGYGGWIVFYVPLCLSVITMADWFERLDQVAQRVSRKMWEWYAPKS